MHDTANTTDRDDGDILHQRVLTLFCEVADSHLPPRNCVCGWEPAEYSDVHALQFALARAALSREASSLALSPVIGHA
jgi:hypothetical protein